MDSTKLGDEEIARGGCLDPAKVGDHEISGVGSRRDDGADEVSVGLPRLRRHHVGTSVGVSKIQRHRVSSDLSVGLTEAAKPVVSSGERSLEDEIISDGCAGGYRVDEGIWEPHHLQHPVRRSSGRVAKTSPNWIGGASESTPTEAPKHFKRSSEGNFVRLNLRTHCRKFTNRNGKRKFQASSRGSRFRRRVSNVKYKAAADAEAEEDPLEMDCLDPDVLLRKDGRLKCGGDSMEAAVLAAREYPSDENLKKVLKLTQIGRAHV